MPGSSLASKLLVTTAFVMAAGVGSPVLAQAGGSTVEVETIIVTALAEYAAGGGRGTVPDGTLALADLLRSAPAVPAVRRPIPLRSRERGTDEHS